MNEEKIIGLFENSMRYFEKENAPKLVKIVNELNGLSYNDAINLLNDAKFVLNNSKINVN